MRVKWASVHQVLELPGACTQSPSLPEFAHGYCPITIDTRSPLSVIPGVGVQENLWRAEVSCLRHPRPVPMAAGAGRRGGQEPGLALWSERVAMGECPPPSPSPPQSGPAETISLHMIAGELEARGKGDSPKAGGPCPVSAAP